MLSINNAIRNASLAASSRRSGKCFKPKPHWCPELSKARDRKRFWWKIWHECGRPRHGAVFDSYKASKKQFRRVSRERMAAVSQDSFNKFNELFYNGKLNAFWKHVKKSRKLQVNSKLDSNSFANFYEQVMTDKGELSAEQSSIAADVERYASELSGRCPSSTNI